MNKPWLQILVPLDDLIQWEIFILIWIFIGVVWSFQKIVRKRTSEERRKLISDRFGNLYKQITVLSILFALYYILHSFKSDEYVYRVLPYIGLLVVLAGSISFIQICRILLLQYLFITSDKTAVPILLVNIFTLGLTVFIAGWLTTDLFGIKVAPLLATSAVFSIILGLALQDTLGNLFAGISLQIDHSFEIGDWIEITQGTQKILGQVLEISWRSTIIVGLLDELICIPNRIVAQSQISNWTRRETPIARSQNFRISYNSDLELAKETMFNSIMSLTSICKYPKPSVLVSETSDSWILVKVIYYINDYGKFATVADEVIQACLNGLESVNISVAYQKMDLIHSERKSLA